MPDYAWLVQYNPLAYIIETTRYAIECWAHISMGLGYTFGVTDVVISGVLIFNRTEKVL
jgi:lipopolysaccharide transport system permease protein